MSVQPIQSSQYYPREPRGISPLFRISAVVAILLFCAGFNYSYVAWISPVWSYQGFRYDSPGFALLGTGYLLAGIACLASPLRISRPSQILYWFLFLTAYLPALFVPLYLQLNQPSVLLALQLSLTSGILLIALFYRFALPRIQLHPVDRRLYWTIVLSLFAVGHVVVLYAFRGNLHLAGLQDVYQVRFPAKEFLREHSGIGYITQFLGFVLNPLLMAYGLYAKRRGMFMLGTIGELALYSTAAGKALIIAPFLLLALHITIKKDRGAWVPKVCFSLSLLFFALTPLLVRAGPGQIFNLGSVILVRTFAVPGAETAEYQYFFGTRPHTHLSHVGGVNLLMPNPYSRPLGEEVGVFFGRRNRFGYANANANLFAMDGIAGFGLPGIPLMGALCGFAFWGLDCCAQKCSLAFTVPALTMVILSITNVSLFTTLLGNGLLAWMILFLLLPRSIHMQACAPAPCLGVSHSTSLATVFESRP
jgi:hypothetical protein